MSTFDTDNTLLFEMLGKGGGTTIAGDATNITALNAQTMSAGTTLFLRTTAITLTSGIGVGYREHDGNASA